MSVRRIITRFAPLFVASVSLGLAGCSETLGPAAGGPVLSIDKAPSQFTPVVSSNSQDGGTLDDYKIEPLDVLEVTVFQVKDLDGTRQVPTNGYVSLPLIGEIKASGKTVKQFEKDIAARLVTKYLRSPDVHVSIKETGQRYTVEGSVNGPGSYPIAGRITLLRAIAIAHDTTRTADSDSIAIFRTADNGQRTVARFDLSAISSGKAEDPALMNGDVVVVGESMIRSVWNDAKDVLAPVMGLAYIGLMLHP